MMVSCSFHFTPQSFLFYFLITFPFLFLTSSDCCLQVVKLLAKILTELIHWEIEVIINLFQDAIHNVVFTKRRTQQKNKWLRIWKQVIQTYFKFISHLIRLWNTNEVFSDGSCSSIDWRLSLQQHDRCNYIYTVEVY